MLEVRLIGKFDIQCDGKPVTISSRAAQSLFAYLILAAGTLHRRENLAGIFWPDAPEAKARAYLRHELWRIRKAFPSSDFLLSNDIGITFDSSADYWLDVDMLEKLEGAASADELIVALSTYQGELLPGFYEEWIVLESEHLRAIYEQMMARLLGLLEREKRWPETLTWAENWISFGHGPEAAYRALMIAYDGLGDYAKVALTYERCVQALRALGLEPSEETRALAFKRTSKLSIPFPLTSFIGRERELKEVAELLSKSRLVTLTGSGGVGKTRLAIQVVADLLDRFPDGVWCLDLAAQNDPALVPNTLVNLLGLRESGELPITNMLINYFQSRTALVIFDNCEHLIESCAQLVNLLLKSCEHLSFLATSREALRVSGETPYRVPSLEIPNPDHEFAIDEISIMESVRLFRERAAVASPGFAINSRNALAIAQICQRLDGIPLAIELAAARVHMLTVEQILKRLDHRFNLLTGGLRSSLPRHQTLHATIEWSYSLLSEQERILFRRLAVFVGGWTLEAAEEVCAGDDIASSEALELLSQLVNKSLVIAEESQNGYRCRMLETIRQYANEKLVESGESDLLRDNHLEYFLSLGETADPHLIRPEQLEWLAQLDADHENLRLALEWALSKDTAEPLLNLCRALGWFWVIRCYWLEGLNWLTRALAKLPQDASKNEKVLCARALAMKAYLEGQVGTVEQILSTAEASLAVALEVSDRRDIAIAKSLVGNALIGRGGEDDRAQSLLEQSFAELQTLNEPFWELWSFHELGLLLARQGKLRFRDLRLMSLELARKVGERIALAEALLFYADWLFRDNQVDEARKHAEEADRLYKQIDPANSRKNTLLFANIAWGDGDTQKAKSLCMEMLEHFSLVKEPYWTYICLTNLGLVAMEESDLEGGQAYLEQALMFARAVGIKDLIPEGLTHLSNLFYLQGNIEQFKQNFKESLSLREYINKSLKAYILVTILGSLYFQKPESSAQLLGVINNYDKEDYFPFTPVEKRYCRRAEANAREVLGEVAFESAFVEGQKMSLDEGLDLALKTVEEM